MDVGGGAAGEGGQAMSWDMLTGSLGPQVKERSKVQDFCLGDLFVLKLLCVSDMTSLLLTLRLT